MNPDIKERSFEFAVRIVNLCRELEDKSVTTKALLNLSQLTLQINPSRLNKAFGSGSRPMKFLNS